MHFHRQCELLIRTHLPEKLVKLREQEKLSVQFLSKKVFLDNQTVKFYSQNLQTLLLLVSLLSSHWRRHHTKVVENFANKILPFDYKETPFYYESTNGPKPVHLVQFLPHFFIHASSWLHIVKFPQPWGVLFRWKGMPKIPEDTLVSVNVKANFDIPN